MRPLPGWLISGLLCVCMSLQAPAQTLKTLPPDSFGPTLNSPDYIRVTEDRDEQDSDGVLGLEYKGVKCAYPLRMLAYHRTINDHLGGMPILITYDPYSGAGEVYDPVVNGKTFTFDAVGGLLLRDRQTHSLWSQITGQARQGRLSGKQLTRLPSLILNWKSWKGLHPDSWVLKGDPKQATHYVVRVLPPTSYLSWSVMRAMLSGKVDYRLPADTLVLGVDMVEKDLVKGNASGSHVVHSIKAYPLSMLEKSDGVIHDRVADHNSLIGTKIVIFFDPNAQAAAAYIPGGIVTNFDETLYTALELKDKRVFVDREGSLWDIEGHCFAGHSKGENLQPVAIVLCRWYTWSVAFPESSLFRPQQVNLEIKAESIWIENNRLEAEHFW